MIPFTERTLVIIKPDAVQRGLIGEIISRLERVGLTIVGLKLLQPTLDQARNHYPATDTQLRQMGNKTIKTYSDLGIDPVAELGTADPIEIGGMIHSWNAEFLSSGPVVACVVRGVHCVRKVRAMAGKTMPIDAQPGTIRGDYSSESPAVSNLLKSSVHNLVHASDDENNPGEPEEEITHWFSSDEIVSYVPVSNFAMVKERS
jgi:nucleoside-diphosphate kinase